MREKRVNIKNFSISETKTELDAISYIESGYMEEYEKLDQLNMLGINDFIVHTLTDKEEKALRDLGVDAEDKEWLLIDKQSLS